MDSLTFLEGAAKAKPRPMYVLHGDEHFLKRRVSAALRTPVLGPEDEGFCLSSRDGDKANWAKIHDELEKLPFLSPRRLVCPLPGIQMKAWQRESARIIARFHLLLLRFRLQSEAEAVRPRGSTGETYCPTDEA